MKSSVTSLIVIIASVLLLTACGGGDGGTPPNTAPVADAGADQNVLTKTLVTLDGSGSRDPDGSTIYYTWSIVSIPPGSTVTTLSDSFIQKPTFTPDIDGTYVFMLIVNDGLTDSAADFVSVIAATCNVDREYNVVNPIIYQCAFFIDKYLVDINISSFSFSAGSSVITPLPTHPGDLTGAGSSCPTGSFSNALTISGSCTETYTLEGAFTGPDTWSGSYKIQFTGSCLDCSDQVYSVDAVAQ